MLNFNNSDNQIYAGFWARTKASLLDSLITLPFLIVILYLIGIDFSDLSELAQKMMDEAPPKDDWNKRILDFVSLVIAIGYSVHFVISKKQATIGKRIMNIYIATIDGKKLSLNQAIARVILTILLPFGFLMVAFTKEKTALHDIICNTRVFCGKK
ncbi:MAG: putative RDD family membrane protein YckC [Rickettsiales bacterium]|jgi:uncharacterized RDD family membrane protein YckC